MKKTIIIAITVVSILFCPAQTVVKMKMPAQANEPLKVVVLFEEPVPEGMPVVLGLMGYNITGGMAP